MKRSSSLLLVALCLLASASWAQTPSPAKESGNRCLEKYKQNDENGAMADCTKAIEVDARSTDAYALRAVLLINKGDFEGAIID
jgi:Tfp pilus assembly protein PilF